MALSARVRSWLWTVTLFAPVVLFYVAHYAPAAKGLVPTGFIQMDQAYYMANAREYQDGGSAGIFYSQPFSANYHARPIYFQPQVWLLGQVWKFIPVDPGILFMLFGLVFGLLCIRACLSVLRVFAPIQGRWYWILDILFIWGGGLLFLIGFSLELVHGVDPSHAFLGAFRLDPADGWWFLNLGRNLVYPFEAYYHFLFFAALLSIARARYRNAALLLVLLAFSHPFSGPAACLVFLGWALFERFYLKSALVPRSFIVFLLSTLTVCGLYYGVWMPRNPEHAQLMEQWKLPWLLQFENFAPAYLLVALIAFARVRSVPLLKQFLSLPAQRFLVVWALVIFALENHEFAFEPHQPVHFARGYVWSALFLIGAPWLSGWIHAWMQKTSVVKWVAILGLVFFFCLDNAAWFVRGAYYQATARRSGRWLTKEQWDVLQRLDRDFEGPVLLVSQSAKLGYMAAVYTPYRPYVGHDYNTPDVARKTEALGLFFKGRSTDPLLDGSLMVVAETSAPYELPRPMELVYQNGKYAIYRASGADGRP